MAIALVIGGWFASIIISQLITALIDYAKEQSKLQRGLKKELTRLEKALPKIQAVASAAESGLMKGEGVDLEKWLWQLIDAANEAEDMMDEIEYNSLKEEVEIAKHKVSKTASRLKNIVERAFNQDSTLKRLKKVVKKIDEVAADVDLYFRLVDTQRQQQKPRISSNRDTSSILSTETPVFGRDKEREEVIQKLLNSSSRSDDMKFSILPIVGVGGVGKTTLAQVVYNDKRVQNHFHMRLWVCVSDCFDVTILTKKMLESATQATNSENFDTLQRSLEEALTSKRFLLVLDDVWNDKDRSSWSKLFAPFRSADRGSMILLTTRMKSVAEMPMGTVGSIFLKGLIEDEYWKFFKVCAFRDRNPVDHNELHYIGKQIAKKLKGSPLAAKTICGILSSNLDHVHWKNILESDIWEIEQGEHDIMPALKLSYQHLDAHLKPCFRYCSIFPQDYEFDKERLVWMWIAVGLIQQPVNGNRRLEDIGDDYFESLFRKSFFDCRTRDMDYRVYYVMHDLLHDLAKDESFGECSRVTEHKPKKIPRSVRHLAIVTRNLVDHDLRHIGNLRTLLLHVDGDDLELRNVIDNLLKGLKSLRVLVLYTQKYKSLQEFPDSIGELIHLRYLDICGTQIGGFVNLGLYHLQVMICGEAIYPTGNLLSLRHLIMGNASFAMIPNVGKLTSLQELKSFCVKKETGYKIHELKNMRELRKLHICNLENVGSHEEAVEANLKDKVHLNSLSLRWDSHELEDTYELEELVLDQLQPPEELKELDIIGYSGASSPRWMTMIYMSNLVSIKLGDCKRWEPLPPLEQLPFLKSLWIEKMSAIKLLDCRPNWDGQVSGFPSLEVLHFLEMPEWREWHGGEGIKQWLPCLKELRIFNCHKLKVLPCLPPNLKDLCITRAALTAFPELHSASLSSLHLCCCPNLTSLPDILLRKPERFTALEKLTILECENLMHLPVGGFRKLICLKGLRVQDCPKLQISSTILENKNCLPSSLQVLTVGGLCGDLEASLPKSLSDLTSLSEIEIIGCKHLTSLPPADVFRRLTALRILTIRNCKELVSLGGLQDCVSLKRLDITGCDKLTASVVPTNNPSDVNCQNEEEDSSSTLDRLEIRNLAVRQQRLSIPSIKLLTLLWELPSVLSLIYLKVVRFSKLVAVVLSSVLSSSKAHNKANELSSLSLEFLYIDSPSLLLTVQLKNANSKCLVIENGSQLVSLPEQWLMRNCTSMEELRIHRANVLQSLPANLQRLSSLRSLELNDAHHLQSLPKMPCSLKVLCITSCNHLLKERCQKDAGSDWPNIADVPMVIIY